MNYRGQIYHLRHFFYAVYGEFGLFGRFPFTCDNILSGIPHEVTLHGPSPYRASLYIDVNVYTMFHARGQATGSTSTRTVLAWVHAIVKISSPCNGSRFLCGDLGRLPHHRRGQALQLHTMGHRVVKSSANLQRFGCSAPYSQWWNRESFILLRKRTRQLRSFVRDLPVSRVENAVRIGV